MKTIYPSYYKNFKCIADRCRHSCCIGWEINIDQDSLDYYDTVEGAFADRLEKSISYDGTPHFILKEGNRCPFLNESGLCDMITCLGEDSLCEICAEHPRFRNYYENCVETGLGLCCEAAAELILKSDEAFALENFDLEDAVYTDEERSILTLRCELIDIMKDRSLSMEERMEKLLSRCKCRIPDKTIYEWCDFYLSLERLDVAWTELLCRLKKTEVTFKATNENAFEQLVIYFLYRYVCASETLEDAGRYVCFSVLSTRMISALHLMDSSTDTSEYARMYSSEIEYSDENVLKICELFE